MKTIDFSKEMASHVIWNVKLRRFLDGGECITEKQLLSYRHCDLGKWLYSEGMDKYSTMPEVLELEKVHIELHAVVKRVVQAKQAGDVPAAELEFKKLELVSKKIIPLLAVTEKRISLVEGVRGRSK